MENTDAKGASGDSSQSVRVAVNIRPLITPELLIGCTDCITVTPGEPQVHIGSHTFTFDHVYGSTALPSYRVFEDCVAPLVDALFHGYNATVLAYGQTGSGKTYTMGTNYTGQEGSGGIIPKVMETIFSRVDALKDSTEFLIRVSFIEIFKEEVFDLLDPNPPAFSRGEGVSLAKAAVPARVPIQIRETVNGGITLAGVTEPEVRTKEEMASFLSRGSLSRATGSTNMNSQSSRSHAIFTISMEQKKIVHCSAGAISVDLSDDILSAKLHLVDLAGSERAKRTGADGLRFKEGIHINKGLLALGNVISALGDEKKRKEGGHVPYRDSKLTRLLQDSLGGNSKTVMIACVSPADTNAEETLNTLKYANRARNIQNKAVINRDPVAAQMQRMRSQIEQLQAELVYFRGDASPLEELQILKHKIALLESSNCELQRELKENRITCEHLSQRAIEAQVEKDKLILKIEAARNGKSWDAIDSSSDEDVDLVKNYVSKIQELEGELLHLQSLKGSHRGGSVDCSDSENDQFCSKSAIASLRDFSSCESKVVDIASDVELEDNEKELEHSSLQEKLDLELKELDKKLEQKEAEMKRFTSTDTSVLKHHYEKKVQELEQEKKSLQREIEELRHNLANISSTSDDGAQKLKEEYLLKLNILEAQVAELKKKQDAQAQLLRQKQKSDEAAKRLQDEIQRIKSHKVQLQHKIKQESEQFRLWKASREKEVLQLKKEGRRNEYEMHKLLALNQRQKMVLQRKTEEASMATKRLKELLESRKTSRETSSAGNGPGIQALMQAIEHELEVTLRVHEVRSEYERQMEERARMAKEVARLKEEAETLKQQTLGAFPQAMSPGARNSRIFALENMLSTSSSTLVSMASQLSEAEERERVFSGRGRWNQVRSLAEAKNIMNYLFNLASSSRCQLWDKEVDCREKISEIRELKEKIVKLNVLVKQLENQLKSQKLASKRYLMENSGNPGVPTTDIGEGHIYDLRKAPRSSAAFNYVGLNLDLMEDMDTSESEHSDIDASDEEWVSSEIRAPKKKNLRQESVSHPIKTEDSSSDMTTANATNASRACCSCSRQSFCKRKCECRGIGGMCGPLCGCVATRCTNRGSVLSELDESDLTEECSGEFGSDEREKSQVLASQGAILVQSALADKPPGSNENCPPKRKPLSDIGNTLPKSNAAKPPNQRKKWQKLSIQLVPTAPLPPPPVPTSQAESNEMKKTETDIPLKLPRAMRSQAATNSNNNNNNPLRDRNADHLPDDNTSMNNKEGGSIPVPRSSVQQKRPLDEKENHGL